MFDLRAIITALMYETKPLERRTAVSPRRGDMMMVNAKYTGGPCIVYNFVPEEKGPTCRNPHMGPKIYFILITKTAVVSTLILYTTLYEDPM